MNEIPAHAEEAVLAGLMARNEAFHDVAPMLTASSFTSPLRQRIWGAIRDRVLAGEPADAVTLMEALRDDDAAVLELAANATTGGTVTVYAGIVRENYRMREAGRIAQCLLGGARERDSECIDRAMSELLSLNAQVSEHEFTGKQILQMAYQLAEKAFNNGGLLPGITTGLPELDDILGGWHDSDLTIIGARPAMGKTAFMLGLAEAAAMSGKRVGVVSAEQPAVQIGIRRAAMTSGVAAQRIRAGAMEDEDWGRITAAIRKSKDLPYHLYDRSAVTLEELVAVGRKWRHAHGIDILFVDYAQRITVPGSDRITEVSQVARGMKNLARDLDIPLVSLAQVVKGVDSRNDKRPNAGDLANSDELTREADQILMLYRDEVYNRESPEPGIAEILIEKNRHGPTGFKKVRFAPETMQFLSLRDNRFDGERAA